MQGFFGSISLSIGSAGLLPNRESFLESLSTEGDFVSLISERSLRRTSTEGSSEN